MKNKMGKVLSLRVMCYPKLNDDAHHLSFHIPVESAFVALVALTVSPSVLTEFHSSRNFDDFQFSMVSGDHI